MPTPLKDFKLVRTEGLKGIDCDYGFYEWHQITNEVAWHMYSTGSHYVEKIEPVIETPTEQLPTAPTKQKGTKSL